MKIDRRQAREVALQAMLVLGKKRLRKPRFIRARGLRQALPKRGDARLRGGDARRALFPRGDTVSSDLQQPDEKRQRGRVEQQGHHDDACREQDQQPAVGKGSAARRCQRYRQRRGEGHRSANAGPADDKDMTRPKSAFTVPGALGDQQWQIRRWKHPRQPQRDHRRRQNERIPREIERRDDGKTVDDRMKLHAQNQKHQTVECELQHSPYFP